MKKVSTFSLRLYLSLFMLSCALSSSYVYSQSRSVIDSYTGWVGNPDTVTVYIDDSFTNQEKDSVRVAIQRWNDAGCEPALKEVGLKPGNVTVVQGDPGDGNAGVYDWTRNAEGKTISGTITIRNNPNPGLVETATHELGHALGLDDVDHNANPNDVMKGKGPSNGSNGNLSQNDSTELRAAEASITPLDDPADKKKVAYLPEKATAPGQIANLVFELNDVYPPFTEVSVMPVGDPLISVENVMLEGMNLMVDVFIDPMHGSGKFYLDIMIMPPLPQDPETFLGYHFTHITPVDPLTFNCPMNIYQSNDGRVHVEWRALHDYPHPNPLNGLLSVNGNYYKTREDFVVDLPPGMHTFELSVNDFQVNSSSSVASFEVDPPPIIDPGIDPYTSPCALMHFGDDLPALPADFFGPGSDPFYGPVYLQGQHSDGSQLPLGDLLINRLGEIALEPPYPSTTTVPIEIVELSLQSSEPITVKYGGEWAVDSFFDLFVEIEPATGNMEIIKEHAYGGSFLIEFIATPKFTFVNALDPGDVFVYEPGTLITFSSETGHNWTHSPAGFDPDPSEIINLESPSGSLLGLYPLAERNDGLFMEMDENGDVVSSEGSGYNNGEWYYYPNTDWWNVWFYDHPVDTSRHKLINGTITLQPRLESFASNAEVVFNWSTPDWPGYPDMDRPPLPSDVTDPTLEDLYIVRSQTLFTGSLTESIVIDVSDFIIEDYNPEWLSVDVRGSNFIISSSLEHICFKEEDCPPGNREPEVFGLRVGDWLVAEPWHQWIDATPGAETMLQLQVHDPDDQIISVVFEHNIDGAGWVPFYTDTNGEECPESPTEPCDPLADGWSGYFSAPMLTSGVTGSFRAQVLLADGSDFYVDSFFDVFLDITPPSSFETNVSDFEIFQESEIILEITPEDANIDQVVVSVEKKKNEFLKGIPPLEQRQPGRTGKDEPGDQHCAPTAAAACLKYFADSANDATILGGFTAQQVVDWLALFAKTNSGKWGTYPSDLAAALKTWLWIVGDNYTVRGPSAFDWKTMRNELERSQDVLHGIAWTGGGGHRMTFNSIVNKPLENGKIRVDFMDPWTGEIKYGDLDTSTGELTGFTGAGSSGTLTSSIIVCPREPTVIPAPLPPGGAVVPGPHPAPIEISLPDEGLYWIRIEVIDTDGNKSRKDIVVEREFTEQELQGTFLAGDEACYDSYDVIKTGGDLPFIVENNATVTIAAKERVELNPMTHLKHGSNAHILISESECMLVMENTLMNDADESALEDDLNDRTLSQSLFTVFPNPTAGHFTLELGEVDEPSFIMVEVSNVIGESVIKHKLPHMSSYQFNLSGHQPGIYLIRVMIDDEIGVEKLIKQ
jgi:hypothetical protein